MSSTQSLAALPDQWQGPPTREQLSPDAIRLLGPIVPSGIAIGSIAAAFIGNGWAKGQVTATGATTVTITTTRRKRHTVRDRRNVLVGGEMAAYGKAIAKWRREHPSMADHEPSWREGAGYADSLEPAETNELEAGA